jgi:hypothetical protein
MMEALFSIHDKLIVKEEWKEPVPAFRGTDAPTLLRGPPVLWRGVPTALSTELLTTMRGLFGDQPYRVKLKSAFTMSSSGSGIVNSALFTSGIASLSQFSSFATIFDEFFVHSVTMKWIPASRYTGPIGFISSTQTTVANIPLGIAKLQHSQAAYTTLISMANNAGFEYRSSGDPWTISWKNLEKSNTPTVIAVTGQTLPFQGWGPCSNVANVTGGIQFLGNTTPVLPNSAVLGSFVAVYDTSFRLRM